LAIRKCVPLQPRIGFDICGNFFDRDEEITFLAINARPGSWRSTMTPFAGIKYSSTRR
jgi:hypothetical protein